MAVVSLVLLHSVVWAAAVVQQEASSIHAATATISINANGAMMKAAGDGKSHASEPSVVRRRASGEKLNKPGSAVENHDPSSSSFKLKQQQKKSESSQWPYVPMPPPMMPGVVPMIPQVPMVQQQPPVYYQPQAYQPQAYQPQAYQPQAYQPQAYQPPGYANPAYPGYAGPPVMPPGYAASAYPSYAAPPMPPGSVVSGMTAPAAATPSVRPAVPSARRPPQSSVTKELVVVEDSLSWLGLFLYFVFTCAAVFVAIVSGWNLKQWVKNGNIKDAVSMKWKPLEIAR